MKIIFDLDHTLFDMSSMHEALLEAATNLGVTEEVYQLAYNKTTSWKVFALDHFVMQLEKRCKVPSADLQRQLKKIADMSEIFVYPDTNAALEALKQDHTLYLLSWGDSEWQSNKINQSGIAHHFEEVLTVSNVKVDALDSWCCTDCEVVIVDDKPAVLRAIHAIYPDFHYIHMRRENGKYADQETPEHMHTATNLQEVQQIIAGLN